jgi:hypothetical protein
MFWILFALSGFLVCVYIASTTPVRGTTEPSVTELSVVDFCQEVVKTDVDILLPDEAQEGLFQFIILNTGTQDVELGYSEAWSSKCDGTVIVPGHFKSFIAINGCETKTLYGLDGGNI